MKKSLTDYDKTCGDTILTGEEISVVKTGHRWPEGQDDDQWYDSATEPKYPSLQPTLAGVLEKTNLIEQYISGAIRLNDEPPSTSGNSTNSGDVMYYCEPDSGGIFQKLVCTTSSDERGNKHKSIILEKFKEITSDSNYFKTNDKVNYGNSGDVVVDPSIRRKKMAHSDTLNKNVYFGTSPSLDDFSQNTRLLLSKYQQKECENNFTYHEDFQVKKNSDSKCQVKEIELSEEIKPSSRKISKNSEESEFYFSYPTINTRAQTDESQSLPEVNLNLTEKSSSNNEVDSNGYTISGTQGEVVGKIDTNIYTEMSAKIKHQLNMEANSEFQTYFKLPNLEDEKINPLTLDLGTPDKDLPVPPKLTDTQTYTTNEQIYYDHIQSQIHEDSKSTGDTSKDNSAPDNYGVGKIKLEDLSSYFTNLRVCTAPDEIETYYQVPKTTWCSMLTEDVHLTEVEKSTSPEINRSETKGLDGMHSPESSIYHNGLNKQPKEIETRIELETPNELETRTQIGSLVIEYTRPPVTGSIFLKPQPTANQNFA